MSHLYTIRFLFLDEREPKEEKVFSMKNLEDTLMKYEKNEEIYMIEVLNPQNEIVFTLEV